MNKQPQGKTQQQQQAAPAGKHVVPENVQKKDRRAVQLKADRTKARSQRQTEAKVKRADVVKRAENYAKTHRDNLANLAKQRREARAGNSFFVPAESKVLLVVRIRGINHIDPRSKRILRLFRLRQLHNATFLRVNKATLNMLKHINPYVTYGYPNRKTIASLLYKRGYLKVNGQRIPITSNQVVEAALKSQKTKHNVITRSGAQKQQETTVDVSSVEDLIEEILNVGATFKQANNAIWPFKLQSPKGGFNNKRHPFNQGGDWGNRENYINDLVRRML